MVKVKEDLTGKKFGRLTVIEQAEDKIRPNGEHVAMWKCICDCQSDNPNSEYVIKEGVSLKRGLCKSCGCYQSDSLRKRQTKNLIGKRFGRLTVVQLSHYEELYGGGSHAIWKCICDCQKEKENPEYIYIPSNSLTTGNTKSCGCYKMDRLIESLHLRKTENRYEKQDGYYIGYTSKNELFYFDECDYDLVKEYKWYINPNGYVETSQDKNNHILMHRLIMGLEKYDIREVDHILGYTTTNDNRRYNLRIVTKSQNQMNRRKQSNNTSGIIGVWYNKKNNKWMAEIEVEHEKFRLGSFENKEDAAEIRKIAEDILHRDFSYHNSQLIGNERLQLFEKLYGYNSEINEENVS